LNAIGNFFNGALAIGQSFAGNFNKAVAGILENISKVGNTALYLGNAIKDGGIEGWLSGLNGILGLWKNDLMGMVDQISGKEECECPPQPESDPSAEEQSEDDLLSLDDETSEDQDDNFSSTDEETKESQSSKKSTYVYGIEDKYLVATETQPDGFGNPIVTDIGYGSGTTLNSQEDNQQTKIILKGEITSGNSTSGNSYEHEIKAGDTLWDIAEKELGDGNRWHELQKADGSTFTEEEVRHLQIGQKVYVPDGSSATIIGKITGFGENGYLPDTGVNSIFPPTNTPTSPQTPTPVSKDEPSISIQLFDSVVTDRLTAPITDRLTAPIIEVGTTRTPSEILVPDAPTGTTRTPREILVPDAPTGTTRTSGGILVPDAPTGTTRTPG